MRKLFRSVSDPLLFCRRIVLAGGCGWQYEHQELTPPGQKGPGFSDTIHDILDGGYTCSLEIEGRGYSSIARFQQQRFHAQRAPRTLRSSICNAAQFWRAGVCQRGTYSRLMVTFATLG